jgi:hypothetical protein
MGIFQETGQGVDYQAALSKIEKIVKDNQGQIDSSSGQTKKEPKAEGAEDSNDELYDQVIDDEGNLLAENVAQVSTFA